MLGVLTVRFHPKKRSVRSRVVGSWSSSVRSVRDDVELLDDQVQAPRPSTSPSAGDFPVSRSRGLAGLSTLLRDDEDLLPVCCHTGLAPVARL